MTPQQKDRQTLPSFQTTTGDGTEIRQEALFADDTPQSSTPGVQRTERNAETTKARRTRNVSTLRRSLLSGVEPASATSNMLYCTEEEEDEIKGTGVHALKNYDQEKIGKICEIGKRTRGKGAWEEQLGMGTSRRSDQQSPPTSRNPQVQVGSQAQDTPKWAPETENLNMTTNAVEFMDPQDFQKSILELHQPTITAADGQRS